MSAALEAAFLAGREILEVHDSLPKGALIAAQLKPDDSPITEADMRAHAAISTALDRTGLPVLSEEGAGHEFAERQRWSRYWLVDPLDGTKEFINRNGEFSVNIALMEVDGKPIGPLGSAAPVAGVLYAPVSDLLYFAWKGGGAYRQESATRFMGSAYERALSAERLPVHHQRSAFTVVASRSHPSPETEAFISRIQEQHGPIVLTNMGSALKICLVAEGTADAYPRFTPTMEWDTAAGHAIVNEAGKQLIDLTTGEPMRYNKASLVNSNFIVQ